MVNWPAKKRAVHINNHCTHPSLSWVNANWSWMLYLSDAHLHLAGQSPVLVNLDMGVHPPNGIAIGYDWPYCAHVSCWISRKALAKLRRARNVAFQVAKQPGAAESPFQAPGLAESIQIFRKSAGQSAATRAFSKKHSHQTHVKNQPPCSHPALWTTYALLQLRLELLQLRLDQIIMRRCWRIPP